MKSFDKIPHLSFKFLFLIMFPLAVKMEDEYCRPENSTNIALSFHLLYKDVCPLIKSIILSEETYNFQIDCGLKCLHDPFCAGYNFLKKNRQKNMPNCHLTHTLVHNFHDCNAHDKGWTFYHPVGSRKVPCHKMKNCKNGGNTIIYLKGGPGTDPYMCECPKGYSGDLCQIDPTPSVDSAILSGEPADFLTRLTSWAGNTNTIWNLCWRATKHGWALSTFHSKCDYKKPTVTIIKVGNFIFGGYATESWGAGSQYKQAPGSFIFSLSNKENLPPFKASLKDQNTGNAIYASSGYGPTFGGGHDIYISDNAASNTNSYTNFNHQYQAPSGVSSTSNILAGTYSFTPTEIEVFCLVQN